MGLLQPQNSTLKTLLSNQLCVFSYLRVFFFQPQLLTILQSTVRISGYSSVNSAHKWIRVTDLPTSISGFVHYLLTYKLYFLTTFSLKIGLTVLFTYLKIILLQCFQFQLSVSAKISSIQTDSLGMGLLLLVRVFVCQLGVFLFFMEETRWVFPPL